MLPQRRTSALFICLLGIFAIHWLGVLLFVVLAILGVAFFAGVVLAINSDMIAKEKSKQDVLFELRLPENESRSFTQGLSMIDSKLQDRINTKQFEYNLLMQAENRKLTGLIQLDAVINKMIELCLKDFIQNWYSKLNSDQAFLIETRLLIEHCVIAGSEKVKSADWFLFLTRKILQEVVTHIRVYKAAEQQMLAQSLRQSEKQDDSSQMLTIEDWFFKIEQEKTQDSFQAVCTCSASEYEYQKRLVDILMLYLMPQREYDCVLLRDLLKEVFTKRVISPTLNYASNPKTINYIIHTRAPSSLNHKAFVRYLESSYIPTSDLRCVINFFDKEIQDLTRKGSSDREHSHLESLKRLRKYCKFRLKQQTDESTSIELSNTTSYSGRAMMNLLFSNVILFDEVIDFLSRSKDTRREAQFLEDAIAFGNTFKFVDSGDGENTQQSMRENAIIIFSNYLTNSSNTFVQLDNRIIGNLSKMLFNNSKINPDVFKEAIKNVCSRLQEQGAYHDFLKYYDLETSIYEDNLSPVKFGPLDYSSIILDCSTIKCSVSDYSIEAETNILGRSVVQYKLDIECIQEDGLSHRWSLQKRFSDFDAFHKGIIEHGIYLPPDLTLPQKFGLFIPSTQALAEVRRRSIEAYLSRLLDLIRALPALRDELASFLAPQNQVSELYLKSISSLNSDPGQNDNIVTDSDSDQLIERILELIREIFNLKPEEDQSFYNSLNSIILQSLIKTTQAEKLHRKLYENYSEYTDPTFLAELLTKLTTSIWPQDIFRGASVHTSDKNSEIRRQRVEILARLHLLNSLPEELVALLKSKVTDKGMNRLFDVMQHEKLNKRFIYVIIESALEFILPNTIVKQELTDIRAEFTSNQNF